MPGIIGNTGYEGSRHPSTPAGLWIVAFGDCGSDTAIAQARSARAIFGQFSPAAFSMGSAFPVSASET
jgi:hypothetical protein